MLYSNIIYKINQINLFYVDKTKVNKNEINGLMTLKISDIKKF